MIFRSPPLESPHPASDPPASSNAWRQQGDFIEVGFFCHCRDLCAQNVAATVIGLDLTLIYESHLVRGPVFGHHPAAIY